MDVLWQNVQSAAVFAFLGVALFIVAFMVLDLITPGKLWHEISEKRNNAAAILMGSVAIALGVIVAAAIH